MTCTVCGKEKAGILGGRCPNARKHRWSLDFCAVCGPAGGKKAVQAKEGGAKFCEAHRWHAPGKLGIARNFSKSRTQRLVTRHLERKKKLDFFVLTWKKSPTQPQGDEDGEEDEKDEEDEGDEEGEEDETNGEDEEGRRRRRG